MLLKMQCNLIFFQLNRKSVTEVMSSRFPVCLTIQVQWVLFGETHRKYYTEKEKNLLSFGPEELKLNSTKYGIIKIVKD